MINYLLSYEYYLKKCEQYGLEPLNYRSFISNLTDEQLIVFTENATNDNELYEYSFI